MPTFSLVVATRGRKAVLGAALESFARQTLTDVEVIVVDQNPAGFLDDVLNAWKDELSILHINDSGLSGLSRSRNVGLSHASGRYVCFPDDDCTYPPDLLQNALDVLTESGMDIVTGRAADETGRTINGRLLATPVVIDRSTVFVTQIEWVAFYRRSVIAALGGFDEAVGVGADSPWQSAEGPELMFRALDAGYRAYYTPNLFGHHAELDIRSPDAAMLRKARAYGRGMGYVMGRHRPPWMVIATFIVRPALGAVLNLVRGSRPRALYYGNTLLGRVEGLRDVARQRKATRIR